LVTLFPLVVPVVYGVRWSRSIRSRKRFTHRAKRDLLSGNRFIARK
jgi:hypothetical protein